MDLPVVPAAERDRVGQMENPVRSTLTGRVSGLGVAVGDTVTQGQRLGSVSTPEEAPAPL